MAVTPPAPTLPCKECNFVNEPERVYCHNCGAKLDRSLLPKEEQVRREPPDRARKRIMRMTNPGGTVVKRELFALAKTLLFAFIVAGLVLALRAPEATPPAKGEMSTRLVSSELSQAITAPQVRLISFTQGEINTFLATGKVAKAGSIPGVEYKRSFVNLEGGVCRLTVERSYWGYPMFLSTFYRAEATGGVFFATNVGGAIGRLPIHPLLMQYAGPVLFRDLAAALKPEYDSLRKAAYLRIEKQKVTIAGAGSAH